MRTDAERYLIVGLSTNILNFGIFSGLRTIFEFPIFFCSAGAYLIAISYSFLLTNYFVFNGVSRHFTVKKIISYIGVVCASALLQAQTTYFFAGLLENDSAGWLAGAFVAAIFNYGMLKRFVF